MLSVNQLQAHYGTKAVLTDLNLQLLPGQIGCLVGPSGCGKTTALRLIAGFEIPDQGEIWLGSELVSQARRVTPPHLRKVGVVFQDYALFPHLSVQDNIAFGLPKTPLSDRKLRIQDMLELVGLTQEARRYPHQLSGGQQQRVALARALAPRPRLLLLDEPFSNLDVELREKLSLELREILKHEAITALFVTHDQHEAFAIADMVGVLHQGKIEQWDTPYNLYHQPKTRFVADFIGLGALLPGKVINAHQVEIELGILQGSVPSLCAERGGCERCGQGCQVDVLIRPDDLLHDDASPLLAEVERKAFRGAEFLYTLKLPQGHRVLVLVPSHHNHAIGERIGLRLTVDHVVAFRPEADGVAAKSS